MSTPSMGRLSPSSMSRPRRRKRKRFRKQRKRRRRPRSSHGASRRAVSTGERRQRLGGVRHWNTPCPTRLFFVGVVNFLMRFDFAWAALLFMLPAVARSQQAITRQQAVEAAITRGARAAVARADTLVGAAQLISARQWDNPSLSASYSKSTPHYHEIIDLPLDITRARSARIRSAEATRLASQYRFRFERAAAALDADTTYTRALAALEHVHLARRNAKDADSF